MTIGTRLRIGPGAVVVLLLAALAVAVLVSALANRPGSAQLQPVTSAAPVTTGIFVHVLGAVTEPGLYQLREGDRVIDAIASAGGYAAGADEAELNLARVLSDGEQLYVPVIGELPALDAGGAIFGGKVNLNSADQAALESLPRVGPAMAARIIEWREANGRFAVIDDLLSVTGIGEKTFEGLRELVTV